MNKILSKLNQYKDKFKALEVQNSSLSKENRKLKAQLLEQSSISTQEDMEELSIQVKTLLSTIATLKAENKKLKSEPQYEPEQRLKQGEITKKLIKAQLSVDKALKLEESVTLLRKENLNLSQKLKEYKQALDSEEQSKAESLAELQNLREEVVLMQNNLKPHKISQIESEIYELEGKYKLMEEERDTLKEQNTCLTAELKEINTRFELTLLNLSQVCL